MRRVEVKSQSVELRKLRRDVSLLTVSFLFSLERLSSKR